MRNRIGWCVAIGLELAAILGPSPARGQGAVAFAPVPAAIPDGVNLGVTPAVSADRRYVRLSVGIGSQTVTGFSNINVPAAAGNGGFGFRHPRRIRRTRRIRRRGRIRRRRLRRARRTRRDERADPGRRQLRNDRRPRDGRRARAPGAVCRGRLVRVAVSPRAGRADRVSDRAAIEAPPHRGPGGPGRRARRADAALSRVRNSGPHQDVYFIECDEILQSPGRL